jgi:hypothetical protein
MTGVTDEKINIPPYASPLLPRAGRVKVVMIPGNSDRKNPLQMRSRRSRKINVTGSIGALRVIKKSHAEKNNHHIFFCNNIVIPAITGRITR